MSQLEQAVELAFKRGDGNGSDEKIMRSTLMLCARNKGLLVGDDYVAAWFRYNPDVGEAVAAMDFSQLSQYNLTEGKLMHIAYLTAPKGKGSRLIRKIINLHNPWGVSAFFKTRDGNVFHSKINPNWRSG